MKGYAREIKRRNKYSLSHVRIGRQGDSLNDKFEMTTYVFRVRQFSLSMPKERLFEP